MGIIKALTGYTLAQQLQAAARINRASSPIAGKLWPGTPLSNIIAPQVSAAERQISQQGYYQSPAVNYNNRPTSVPTPNQSQIPNNNNINQNTGQPGVNSNNNNSVSTNTNQNSNQPDYSQQISDLYAPTLNQLGVAEQQIRENAPVEEQNFLNNMASQEKGLGTQQEQLLGDVQTEESKYNDVIRTALEDASRAFNALNQQRGARFGFGSSAGQAVGELAQQEFFRQQGQTQQKGIEGTKEFGIQKGKIKSFVAGKLDELKAYKDETLLKLKQDFQDKLNEIASRRVDTEANKAKDRMGILQNTLNYARDIANQDKQFRQQLGLAAVSKMQEIAGRAFTPKEIQVTMNDFLGMNFPNLSSGPTQAGGYAPAFNPNTKGDQYDQFGNLINPYG